MKLTQNRQVFARKFSEPQKTTVSMWFYDTGSKAVRYESVGEVSSASVRTQLGVHDNHDYYSYREGASFTPSSVPRSEGWHNVSWDCTDPSGFKMYIDGILVHTSAPSDGFTEVYFGDMWNQGGAAGDISYAYFDDITIGEPQINPVPVELNVSADELTLMVEDTYQVNTEVLTEPDFGLPVEFKASEAEVARVDENGLITAVRPGESTITVSVEGYPDVKKEIPVHVIEKMEIPVESIRLTPSKKTLTEGESFQLDVKVLPANATNKAVSFSSSDPDVAAVDSDGMVYANHTGTAEITVVSADGNAEASMEVTVNSSEYVLDNAGFEKGNLSGWSQYPAMNSEGISISVTQEDAFEGSYAAKVTTTDSIQVVNGSGYWHK